MRSCLLLILLAAVSCRRTETAAPSLPSSTAAPVPVWQLRQLEQIPVTGVDLHNPEDVFYEIFRRLPDEVTVFPTENYYYWRLQANGRDVWGNIRLASGRREKGELSFGYEEHATRGSGPKIAGTRVFSAADGVMVTCPTPFSALVEAGGRRVGFHFLEISQSPPACFVLRSGEFFVQRTCDESGLRFLLLFDSTRRALSWILDEEEPVPEQFDPVFQRFILGQRTGFLFWQDHDRKVLAAVSHRSREENDYFDGPFDQLADNYAAPSRVKDYLMLAYPDCRGNIDVFGYFTDHRAPKRVAVMTYGTYLSPEATAREFHSRLNKHGLIPDFAKMGAD